MTSSSSVSTAVLVLAAGQGTRMRSSLPKVLAPIGGSPMICQILSRIYEASPSSPIGIVVGAGREQVESALKACPEFKRMNIQFIHQAEQKGTGHAARIAMESPWGANVTKSGHQVLVLPGDLPLIPSRMIEQMMEPLSRAHALRLLTTQLPDPTGYGRVIRRGKKGGVLRIVEEKDANPREKLVQEVGLSIYTFRSAFLSAGLRRLTDKNAQKEYYLPDLVAQAARASKKIDVLSWSHHEDLLGVNNPWELATAARILNQRSLKAWALKGVRFMDPTSTWVDADVELAEDVIVGSGVVLSGQTLIARGTILGPNVVLKNVRVGVSAHIKTGTVGEDSIIEDGAQIGPYAHLRPGSTVGPNAKIGNFVELKNSTIGAKTSVAHLSYLGDAEVGQGVNIGCGFVTCNFDGRVIDGQRKHKTIIEDGAFIGSDCQTVAPVRIGRGAYVASGSTITEEVESEALAIARSRQVNKPGYAKKLKENS